MTDDPQVQNLSAKHHAEAGLTFPLGCTSVLSSQSLLPLELPLLLGLGARPVAGGEVEPRRDSLRANLGFAMNGATILSFKLAPGTSLLFCVYRNAVQRSPTKPAARKRSLWLSRPCRSTYFVAWSYICSAHLQRRHRRPHLSTCLAVCLALVCTLVERVGWIAQLRCICIYDDRRNVTLEIWYTMSGGVFHTIDR